MDQMYTRCNHGIAYWVFSRPLGNSEDHVSMCTTGEVLPLVRPVTCACCRFCSATAASVTPAPIRMFCCTIRGGV